MTASKNIKGRAPNAWNVAQRLRSETRVLDALRGGPMSRNDLRKACHMGETTVWRIICVLLEDGRVVDAEPRTGVNRCQERMFQRCDPAIGPIPPEKKSKQIEKVSRDPFIAVLFGAREARAVTQIPARIHRMADDEAEAA